MTSKPKKKKRKQLRHGWSSNYISGLNYRCTVLSDGTSGKCDPADGHRHRRINFGAEKYKRTADRTKQHVFTLKDKSTNLILADTILVEVFYENYVRKSMENKYIPVSNFKMISLILN